MSRLLLPLVLAGLLLAPSAKVYICQGSASYAYHATDCCEALAWCTRAVVSLSKSETVKKGRRPCQRCAAR